MSSLLKACERLRDDLLLRGEQDADGTIVVNASASVWSAFNDAIDNATSLEKQLDEAHGWIARAMMKGCCNEDITKEALQEIIDQRDIEQQETGVNHIGAMLIDMGFDGVESLCEKAIEQLRKGGEL